MLKNKLPKKIALTVASFFVILFSSIPTISLAQPVSETASGRSITAVYEELNGRKPLLEIRIPGLTFSNIASSSDETGLYFYISWIPELISAVYKFSIAIASIVAVVIIILQGMRLITSAGSSEATSEAYKKITHAVIGLFIAWGSFLILYTVNPNLVEFNPLKIKVVERQELDVSPSTETEVDVSDIQQSTTVPYFGQYDSRWAQLKPGDPQWPFDTSQCKKTASIIARGCGSTSLAMILKSLNRDVTPIETSRFALGCSGAMSQNNLQQAWSTGPWADLKLQFFYNEKALELAAKNIPLIMNCHPCNGYTGDGKIKTYSGHYMVITGSSDNGQTFNINDPGGNPKKNNAIIKMTREQILTPNRDQVTEGCNGNSECLAGIKTIRKPSFIYIHQ